jgi:PAS domain S-box-containing protein
MLQVEIVNITLSIATSAMSLLLAARAWRQRQTRAALWFSGMVGAVAWITWWYAFESAVGTDLDAYISLSKVEYIGLTFIPLLWLGFALNFTGQERRLSRLKLALLAVIPLVTIVLAFTNEFHGLIWKQPRFDMSYPAPVYAADYGLWFWIYVIYSYTIFLLGSILLVRYALSTWRLYRNQALLIFAGTALPWISNFLTIFHRMNPAPYLYLNAFFMGACVVCFAFALFRLRLLDVVPLAYDTILNNIPEGIIVVDLKNRIVAVNSHVKSYLDNPSQDLIGQPVMEALSRYASYFEMLQDTTDYVGEFEIDDRVLELHISLVIDRRGQKAGRLFVISDVTLKARAEQAQRAEQRFYMTMNRVGGSLNSSLDVALVASLILESLDQFIPHSCSNIMLVDDDGFTTRVFQHRGYSPEEAAIMEALVLDYRDFPLYFQTAQRRTPFVVPDTQQEPGWIRVAGLESVCSFASMPIVMDGRLIGFINVDSQIPGTIKAGMVNWLRIFGQQASLAIRNARLYEETYRQAEELKRRVNSLMITQQVYKEIGFSLDPHVLFELVLDATLRVSAADGGYIALARGDVLELMQHYGNYDQKQLDLILNTQLGVVGQSIEKRHMLVAQIPSPLVTAMEDTQAQIALPLFAHTGSDTEIFYGIIVLETNSPHRFTSDRLQLLGLIADRVAVAFHNTQLVATVRERAAELEELYDKVSYLEKFKSDMIRIAAHDLKNPLHVIRNYLSLLTEPSDLEVDSEKAFSAMQRSSDRMLQIIQNFLSLDRIEQAAEQQTMQPFDLRSVVTSALGEFMNRAMQKSQQLDYNLPEGKCMVVGDAVQIHEAVVNFVSNAIKYTPDGGKIVVNLWEEGAFAQLEVSDNGYGVPKEQQEKLFQPFYRAQSSEVTQIEGTGLGLHLTKNIIERQGGKIIFRSTYHQGSTFGFQLALYQQEPIVA